MNLIERAKSPTPKFFRVLRSIGLALLAISGSVIAAPVVLPVTVVTVAGYLAVAGGVISAVSQMTVDPSTTLNRTNKGEEENQNKPRHGD
ncbi:hypothetical protein [Flavobacterium gawalongense]|uniref:Uncharacterized protein n=1 Tax=Flavobacterium gawalongense TaxID=2594432 RepID=A0ABY3CKK3_9FLAO|nr:hypothetical protein [Flavobacterium gawalongense]TRX01361.1 hypothetical protein FNW33_09625 [Flavobacterium gawalongense]TRX05885.1 hypothetical protein FNW12_09710 [Flavobacterium gawalongense]